MRSFRMETCWLNWLTTEKHDSVGAACSCWTQAAVEPEQRKTGVCVCVCVRADAVWGENRLFTLFVCRLDLR